MFVFIGLKMGAYNYASHTSSASLCSAECILQLPLRNAVVLQSLQKTLYPSKCIEIAMVN